MAGVKMLARLFRHLWNEEGTLRRAFPPAVLARIGATVTEGEGRHSGELRFAIEGGLSPQQVIRRQSARDRAIELFGALGIWDTERNNGVLIYVLLADHQVEIVADRGIHAKAGAATWEGICTDMQRHFAIGAWEEGAVRGVQAVSAVLAEHFPGSSDNPNELPDQPLVL